MAVVEKEKRKKEKAKEKEKEKEVKNGQTHRSSRNAVTDIS
jgi:hypothetical protein